MDAGVIVAVELSVVVPVHNEAGNVEPLADEIRAALAGVTRYEIVFVDDGSSDGTGEQLNALAQRDPLVRVVPHAARAGQSAALVTGVRAARGRLVATLDGDGQNDPADIPRLLPLVRNGSRLVTGFRRARRDSFVTRASSRVANAVRSRLLGDGTPDTGCGLKVFRRDDFLMLPVFDHMHRFLPALFRRAGGNVTSVEVRHRGRRNGRSHYGMWGRLGVGLVDLFGVWWLQRRAVHPSIEERPHA